MEKFEYITISTKLFEGFYESNLYSSDTLYNLDEEIDYDDNFDYTSFQEQVSKDAVDLIAETIPDEGIIENIEYMGLWSPRWYNYTTDKLKLRMDVNFEKLKDWILQNESKIKDLLEYYNTYYDVPKDAKSFVNNFDSEFAVDLYLTYYWELEGDKDRLYENASYAFLDNIMR